MILGSTILGSAEAVACLASGPPFVASFGSFIALSKMQPKVPYFSPKSPETIE